MTIERSFVHQENWRRRTRRGVRSIAIVCFGLATMIFAASNVATMQAAPAPQLKSSPQAVSAPKLSDHEIEALPSMSP